jgi:dTDP-4-dehydrorhamnose reductase
MQPGGEIRRAVAFGRAFMRIVVIGSNGQLGRDLVPRLPGTVVPLTRIEIDLAKLETIQPAILACQPDVVINCAAYNLVDQAESDPDVAFRVNAWGVRELAKACDALNARLIHISTDYVFGLDRERLHPLSETDEPGPLSTYGLSKLTGEYLVRTYARKHLVIRTCGLYGVWGSGGKGTNFVETMLRLASSGKPVRVVNDQRCTPTYTVDLARVIAQLVSRDLSGLLNVTNSEDCTWYELAAEVFRLARLTVDLTPISSEQFGARAKRPDYSVLSTDRFTKLGLEMQPWKDALSAYMNERSPK